MSCPMQKGRCTADAAAKAGATIPRAAAAAAVTAEPARAASASDEPHFMTRPRVAITTGDPAGIGPEIAARAAADPRVLEACEPRLYGPPGGASFDAGVLSAAAGRAAYDSIVRAVDDAQSERVDAIATAPVNKEAFRLAGLPWSGHTDLLAHLTRSPHVAMMFHSDVLRVVLATVHIPLSEVPRALTAESLERTIALTARELPRFGVARPRIAVAGLHPHAG